MKTAGSFNPRETRALAEIVRSGSHPCCPQCAVPLDEWPVPPRADVSYVRDRMWLVCPSCHRSAVIDRRDPP